MTKKDSAYNAHWVIRIIIVLVVAAIMAVSVLFFEDQINKALGLKRVDESAYNGATNNEVIESTSAVALNVHFIDVGQGDACIIQFPDYKTMLIDGANNGYGDTINDYIEQNIKDKNGNTITKFDYAMLTHSDSDHCASMDEVLNEYPCDVFYRPNVKATRSGYTDPNTSLLYGNYTSKDTVAYKNAIAAGTANASQVIINKWDMPAITGNDGAGKDYSLSFYGPSSDEYGDWNNYSPIMILEYNGIKMALTGDCEKEGEQEFVAKAQAGTGKFSVFDENFHCDVIKAGHHGSRTSTSTAFVETVTKSNEIQNTLIVVSCGLDNSYGHPHQEKLDQFKQNGIKDENILRTDRNGTIVLSVNDLGQLLYGASPIVKTPVKVVDWRYIAISITIAVALIVLIYPAVRKAKSMAKAEVRSAIRNISDDSDKTNRRSSTRKSSMRRNSTRKRK
ncbi:MAG: hypothetical protein IJY70_06100 [Clostridia bacterium]|nr:hypothetical protein [Clostridia bacterium]